MRKIILDTNILLRQPRVMGLEIPDTEFLIPLDVIEELNVRATNRGAKFDRRIDLIEKANLQGTVKIVNVDAPTFRQYRDLLKSSKLSGADLSIVAIAINLKEKGEDVLIATLDKEIWRIAHEYHIGVLSEVDANDLFSKFVEPKTESNNTIQKEIVTYEKKERTNFLSGIFIGVFATIVSTLIYNRIDKIIGTINVWGTIIVILVAGVGLFVFREKKRLGYGVFEFLVGIVAIIILLLPNHFDYSTIKFDLDFNIRFLGGLYIMVRGQDNIVKSQKDKKFGLYLKDKFGIGE